MSKKPTSSIPIFEGKTTTKNFELEKTARKVFEGFKIKMTVKILKLFIKAVFPLKPAILFHDLLQAHIFMMCKPATSPFLTARRCLIQVHNEA